MNTPLELSPGQRVVYRGTGGDECGIVIHSWFNDDIGTYDCYVAFFGDRFPGHAPAQIPYVLRYACSSLEKVE